MLDPSQGERLYQRHVRVRSYRHLLAARVMAGTSPSLRFAAFYGAVFLTVGIYLPFWPVFLKGRGRSGRCS